MTDRPDGPLSGLLYDHDQRLSAARRHTTAEGHETHPLTILDSYDRTLHPWIHGRRPADLARKLRERIDAARQ
ncbi:hypothetical protein D3D02_16920 [Halobellus sp. Atlit-38R]|uniref:hypothetical protein n=1 Tax=Halobellus sp. Atlit-38R TaxID=2282131 RepID=UPI000EF1EFEB|nr:hypothetical protein [Halobellus sp. Atlit-38R]RLM83684.1 hypothetical protein D3D02_16920 [Halobellus sp. Atlit-38R]